MFTAKQQTLPAYLSLVARFLSFPASVTPRPPTLANFVSYPCLSLLGGFHQHSSSCYRPSCSLPSIHLHRLSTHHQPGTHAGIRCSSHGEGGRGVLQAGEAPTPSPSINFSCCLTPLAGFRPAARTGKGGKERGDGHTSDEGAALSQMQSAWLTTEVSSKPF
jgi:hypothetical protein